MKIKKILSLMLAVILAFGLAACGGDSSPAPPEQRPQPQAQGQAYDDDYDEPERAYDDDYDERGQEPFIQYNLDVIRANIDHTFIGKTENGEYMCFGINGNDTFALMLFADDYQHVVFVGDAEVVGDEVYITDMVNGMTVAFEATMINADSFYLNLYDWGEAHIGRCSMDEMLNVFVEFVTNTVAVG